MLVLAAAVLLPAHLGTPDRTSAPATLTHSPATTPPPSTSASCPPTVGDSPTHLGADYRVTLSGKFGRLPSDQVGQIRMTVTNGNPDTALTIDSPYIIGLTDSSYTAFALSKLNANRFTHEQGVVYDVGTAELVWRTRSGTWASVSGTDLDAGTVEATLEHVAATATIGTMALTSPIQLTGVPASAQIQLDAVEITQPVEGDPGVYGIRFAVTFGTGATAPQALVSAYPKAHNPDPTTNAECQTISGWWACVETQSAPAAIDAYVPGDLGTLSRGLVVHGQDPSTWSADLIVDAQ